MASHLSVPRHKPSLYSLLLLLLFLLSNCSATNNPSPPTVAGTIGERLTGTINEGMMLTVAFNITDHVSMPFRLSTTAPQSTLGHPVFVSVRQGRYITSWNIPYIQDSHGFLHVERTLCPILNTPFGSYYNSSTSNDTGSQSFIYVDVSTPSTLHQNISILLNYAQQYKLSMNTSVDVTVSAPSPVFYVYEFPNDDLNDVMVKVTSDSNVCALVSVQDGLCPNDLLVEYPSHRGVYQTMEKLSAITYKRSTHQNFFYVVVTILHDDWCSQTTRELVDGILRLNTSVQYNPVSIHDGELYTDPKNISISVQPTISVHKYWIGPMVSFLIYLIFYLVVLGMIIIEWQCFHKQEPFKVFEEMNSTDYLNDGVNETDGRRGATPINDIILEEDHSRGDGGWRKGLLKRPNFISVLKGNNWSSEATRITHTASPKDHEYINQQFTDALVKVYPCPTPSPPAQQTRPHRTYRSRDNQPLLESTDHIRRQLSHPTDTNKQSSANKYWNATSRNISKASDCVVPIFSSPPSSDIAAPRPLLSPRRQRLGVSECHEYRQTNHMTDNNDQLLHTQSYDTGLNSTLEPESGCVVKNPRSHACPDDSNTRLSEVHSISDEVITRTDSHVHSDAHSCFPTETQSPTELHSHTQPHSHTEIHSHASDNPSSSFHTPETHSYVSETHSHAPQTHSYATQSSTYETQFNSLQTHSNAPQTRAHASETHLQVPETHFHIPAPHSYAAETHTLEPESQEPHSSPRIHVTTHTDNFFTFPPSHADHDHTSSTTSSETSSPTRVVTPRLPEFVPSFKHFLIDKRRMSHLTIPEGREFQRRYEGHWAYIVAMVLFYAIPTYQLLLTYQKYLNHSGNEDFCYYNTLCSHRLGVISAFNNIWSNIGFFMLGLLFLIIARRKREKYRYYEQINENFDSTDHSKHKVGVPQHFGIYYAIGVAIMGEGLMSAAYHICPTSSNYQFDTTMMYVLVTLGLYKLYECRNPDKYGRPHKLLLVLALTILFIGMGVLYSEYTAFYVLFFIVFETAAIYTSLQQYYRWIKIWPFSHLKEVALELFCNIFYRPLPIQHKWKFCYTVFTISMNVIWGIVLLALRPIDFGSWFLFVMICNLMTSLIYYVVSKFRYELCQKQSIDQYCQPVELLRYEGCQKRRLLKVFQPILYLLVAIVMWIAGIYFYSSGATNWLNPPSRSRNLNQECIFIGFFDIHDLWHFVSAFALFFSFLLLMTLDDSQEGTNRNKLHIF